MFPVLVELTCKKGTSSIMFLLTLLGNIPQELGFILSKCRMQVTVKLEGKTCFSVFLFFLPLPQHWSSALAFEDLDIIPLWILTIPIMSFLKASPLLEENPNPDRRWRGQLHSSLSLLSYGEMVCVLDKRTST